MNNEKYNQIISEVYGKYLDYLQENEIHGIWYDLEIFINECKTDTEFSERWGMKIEEKELSLEERRKEMESIGVDFVTINMFFNKTLDLPKQEMYEKKIPTKLITVTYKDETIEIYE